MAAQSGKKNIIAGNWKMNLGLEASVALSRSLVGKSVGLKNSEIWAAPSFTALAASAVEVRGSTVRIGAQNICPQKSGAYTGEVSVDMLTEVGASFALVGHSERRALYGETVELCVTRAIGAIEQGLDIVFCVGESLTERESGRTFDVVSGQLTPLLEQLSNGKGTHSLIVAYEPVWAIGTGKVASTEQIAEIHLQIYQLLSKYAVGNSIAPILYGGSVTAENFDSIIALDFVSGALVGGASLTIEKFAPLVDISESLSQ